MGCENEVVGECGVSWEMVMMGIAAFVVVVEGTSSVAGGHATRGGKIGGRKERRNERRKGGLYIKEKLVSARV